MKKKWNQPISRIPRHKYLERREYRLDRFLDGLAPFIFWFSGSMLGGALSINLYSMQTSPPTDPNGRGDPAIFFAVGIAACMIYVIEYIDTEKPFYRFWKSDRKSFYEGKQERTFKQILIRLVLQIFISSVLLYIQFFYFPPSYLREPAVLSLYYKWGFISFVLSWLLVILYIFIYTSVKQCAYEDDAKMTPRIQGLVSSVSFAVFFASIWISYIFIG